MQECVPVHVDDCNLSAVLYQDLGGLDLSCPASYLRGNTSCRSSMKRTCGYGVLQKCCTRWEQCLEVKAVTIAWPLEDFALLLLSLAYCKVSSLASTLGLPSALYNISAMTTAALSRRMRYVCSYVCSGK